MKFLIYLITGTRSIILVLSFALFLVSCKVEDEGSPIRLRLVVKNRLPGEIQVYFKQRSGSPVRMWPHQTISSGAESEDNYLYPYDGGAVSVTSYYGDSLEVVLPGNRRVAFGYGNKSDPNIFWKPDIFDNGVRTLFYTVDSSFYQYAQ
jgi:hypothetical protein